MNSLKRFLSNSPIIPTVEAWMCGTPPEYDKYKDSIILNNIDCIVYAFIHQHKYDDNISEQVDDFIKALIDELGQLYS